MRNRLAVTMVTTASNLTRVLTGADAPLANYLFRSALIASSVRVRAWNFSMMRLT